MSDSAYYIVDLPTPGTRAALQTAASVAHRFIGAGRAPTARLNVAGTQGVVEVDPQASLPAGVRGVHGPMTAEQCRTTILADYRNWVSP